MKRPLAILAVLVLMLALPLMSQAAPPPGVTKAADLFAGKTTDVGDVFVWNDATNVYVEINMDDAWCMTESHVIAALALVDIPQANGNPIPGQFPQGDSYSPCADGDTFTFAIADVGTNPFVAVHVKAWEKTISTATIVSNPGDLVKFATIYPDFGSAVAAVVPTFAGWPAIAGASYISNQAAGDPFDMNAWRSVTETLTVPGLPVGGQLWVNSDNYEFTKLNGVEIQRDDNGPASTVEGTDPEPVVSPQTWQTIENVAFTPKASNTFEFVFRNVIWAGGGVFTDNPTGLIYKASATYYAHSESAWAGTAPGVTAFTGKNWATYFRFDAALETAPVYNVTASPSTTWSCTAGATDTSMPLANSSVTWAMAGTTVYVTVVVDGALASSTFDVWVEQNPGTCPPGTSTPSNPAALSTDANGDGTVSFSFTAIATADNFWLSLWTPAGSLTGTQVLRTTAVALP